MTLLELCEKYSVSESSVTNMWPRTQKSILKKYGVSIIKKGRGKNAYYQEERKEPVSDGRALTMYEETHIDFMLNKDSLNLLNSDFLIFLGIVSTPMAMFRGTPQDFLSYIGVTVNQDNLDMLDDTLLNLADRELICYDVDDDVIILYIRRKAEKEMKLGIEMIQHCRQLAEKTGKRKDSWLKILKVWIAIQIAAEDQPFTLQDISDMTGISRTQVSEYKRILEDDDIFKTSRAGSYLICRGSYVDFNAIPYVNR